MIRLTIPSIEEDDLQAVDKVLRSGYLVQGQNILEFEKTLADYIGVKHAIAVSNCTAALHLSLLSLDIHADDIVLVTTYSYIATANVIELCGAIPVFIDITPDTFNMDPDKLAEELSKLMQDASLAKKIKAILPVHTFGQMADMTRIMAIADRYGIPVIEDAACALGAKWDNRSAGSWGLFGCFSFHPRKAITTGEGGAITTNDDKLTQKVRALRNHGQDPLSPTPDFILPGFNYRLTDFQGAFGVTQMQKIDRIIAKRRSLAQNYNSLIENDPVLTPVVPIQSYHVYQSYVVLLPEKAANQRSRIISDLKKLGIETNIGTWHMPLTTYFKNRYGYKEGNFPVSDRVFNLSLTLPLHEFLTFSEQDTIVRSIRNAIREE